MPGTVANPYQLTFTDYDSRLRRIHLEATDLLAQCLGIKPSIITFCLDLLRQHQQGTARAYISFSIPKSDGGKRQIRAPVDELKHLSRKTYVEFLRGHPLNRHIHGFRPGRSVITNASPHIGAKFVVNMDIQDCFPSTPKPRIEAVYQSTVGNYLLQEGINPELVREVIDILTLLSTLQYGRAKQAVLPMGSPTSPALLNLVLQEFDLRLSQILGDKGEKLGIKFNYTRYGDDLSISTPDTTNVPPFIFGTVPSLLRKYGYRAKRSKTRVMRRNGSGKPPQVTGIIVGEKGLMLPDHWLAAAEMTLIRILHSPKVDALAKSIFRGILGYARMVYGDLPQRLAGALKTAKMGLEGDQFTLFDDLCRQTNPQDRKDPRFYGYGLTKGPPEIPSDNQLPFPDSFEGPLDPSGLTDPFRTPEAPN